ARGALARVALRLHAARVRFLVPLVVLLVLVETVERAAAGAHEAADRRALAGPLAAAGHRAARGSDRGTDDRTDRGVLHHLGRLVLLADLPGGVPVTRVDDVLRRPRRSLRHPRR